MNTNKLARWQQFLFIAGTCILLLGLVCSKALISIGSVVLITAAALKRIGGMKEGPWFNAQVLGFGLLFFAPFVSGIWSESTGDWFQVIGNKIMLPALFWAVWSAPPLTRRQFYTLGWIQVITVLFATFYSIWPLIFQPEGISQSYLQAKTLNVLLSNDHLHFSLYVFITLVLMFASTSVIKELFGKIYYSIYLVIIGWLIVYLHILGAKTGLILLYASFGYYCWARYFNRRHWHYLTAGILGMLLCAMLTIKLIPTLQNRVYYTLYDFNQYIHGAYVDGLTDGARVLSWKAGAEIGRQNPWTGVGFGDMHTVFNEWHQTYSAHLKSYNWLQPSNEWLMYLCGSGIAGMVILTAGLWLIYRYSPSREDLLFKVLFFSQFFMLWYEVNLTNQTGIALFSFFIGWVQLGKNVEKSEYPG